MKKIGFEIKWGIRYIFIYLAWTFLEKYTGAYDQNIDYYFLLSILFYVLAFFVYLIALRDKKENYYHNILEWKQGCASGIYLTIIIAILMPIAQIITHKAIAPEFFPNMIKHSLASKNSNPDAINSYFNLSGYIWQSIFMALSIGIVYSAIVARFLQTKPLKK